MNDYLEHHGTIGQKWGVRNGPPYPLAGGGLRAAIERRKAARAEKAEAKKRKKKGQMLQKAKKAKAKEREKEEKQKQAREKLIQKYMEDPAKLYKHRKKFTKEELDKANERFETEKKLYQLSTTYMNRGKAFLDVLLGYGDTALKAYDLYNKFMGNDNNAGKAVQIVKDALTDGNKPNKNQSKQEKKQKEQPKQENKQKESKVEKVSGDVVDEGYRTNNQQSSTNPHAKVVFDTTWRESDTVRNYKDSGQDFSRFIETTSYRNTPLLLEDKRKK